MKEDIIEMLRQAAEYADTNTRGMEPNDDEWSANRCDYLRYKRFATLVRADEREACAKLIESHKTGANELMDAVRDMEARAIRARGQA
jgi:hypothetical protein